MLTLYLQNLLTKELIQFLNRRVKDKVNIKKTIIFHQVQIGTVNQVFLLEIEEEESKQQILKKITKIMEVFYKD
jgi:hypothetical protein